MQVLQLRAEDNPLIHEWLKRKNETYTTKDNIQNEILKLMAYACLREIATELRSAEYYNIMADETTYASNKEQMVTVFRCVDDELKVHEEFVGLYQLDTTDAKTIVTAPKDVMVALNLDINQLVRSQVRCGQADTGGRAPCVLHALLRSCIKPSHQ